MLLRQHRLAAGLTQEDLAERSGLSARGISDLERAVRTRPQLDTRRRLADALRLSGRDREQFLLTDADGPAPRRAPVGAFLGARPPSALIARNAEVTALLRAADRAAGGAGGLIFLTGEPGAGKTRLAQEAEILLRQRGFLVATGRCFEAEAHTPYYPFLEALSSAYAMCPRDLRVSVPDRWPELARLFPDGVLTVPEPSGAGDDPRIRLFRAVQGFLRTLTQHSPVAVIIDDLQWADHSSIRLLQHLVRHLPDCGILFVGTARAFEVQPSPELGTAVDDLTREGLATTVAIPRLDEGATKALVDVVIGPASPDLAHWIYAHTSGNPLFIRAVLRMLVDRGGITRDRGVWKRVEGAGIEVPDSVRRMVYSRIATMSEGAQSAIEAASVIGLEFAFDDLLAISGDNDETLEKIVQELVESPLVVALDGGYYAFQHVLVHHAVYSGLPEPRRRRLHLTFATAFVHLPRPVREKRARDLARHFDEGGRPDDALPWILAAGDQAEEIFAHGEAEVRYRRALDVAAEIGDTRRRAEAAEKLGSLLAMTASYDEALRVLEIAADSYRQEEDVDHLVGVLGRIVGVHAFRGTPREWAERTQRLLDSLVSSAPSASRGYCDVQLATLYFFSGDYEQQLSVASHAVEIAREIGDDLLLASAQDLQAVGFGFVGDTSAALATLRDACAVAESVDNDHALLDIYGHLALVLERNAEIAEAAAYCDKAIAVAQRLGNPVREGVWKTLRGLVEIHSGQWDDATEHLNEATELNLIVGEHSLSSYPLFCLGLLALRRGELDAAAAHFERSAEIAERKENLQAMREVAAHRAELDLAQGDPERAERRLIPLLDRRGMEEWEVTLLLPALARAQIETGDIATGAETARLAAERAREKLCRIVLPDALRAHGVSAHRLGNRAAAQDALAEAVVVARSLGLPYAEANALADWASILLENGERGAAEERWRLAREIFAALGAKARIREMDERLRVVAIH